MSTYPAGIKSWTPLGDGVDYPKAADFNTAYSEVTAIQTELGVDPAGTHTTVVDRFNAIDALSYLSAGKTRRVYISATHPDPTNPPDVDTITKDSMVVPVMYFDPDTNEKVHWSWYIPPDCDTSYDVTLILDCVIPVAGASSSVSLKLAYTTRANNELVTSSVNVDTVDQSLSGWTAEYRRTVSDLALSQSFTAAGDTISCTLIRNASTANDNYNSDFGIYNISFQYTNKDPS